MIGIDITNFIGSEISKLLIKSYKNNPFRTTVAIITFIAALVGLIGAAAYLEKQKKSDITVTNEQLKDRVEKIDQIQSSLKELDNFLEDQQQSIQNQQVAIQKLKEEKDEIQPLVDANREIIDKVFSIQEKRNKWDIWIGIGIGFLLGIPASFLASLLHDYYKSKKTNSSIT